MEWVRRDGVGDGNCRATDDRLLLETLLSRGQGSLKFDG